MASAVATPLERQFTGIAGLDSMISNSGQGTTSITLQFDLSRDIDGATVDVETAIAEAMPLLPPGMPTPPSFPQGQPRRLAHHQPLPDLAHHAPQRPRRIRRDHDGAAHLHGGRRGPGAGVRRGQIRRARAGGPQRTGQPQDRPQRSRPGHPQLERQHPHRHPVRPAHLLQRPGQRPVDARRRLQAADRHLQATARRCGWTTWPT